MIRFSSFIILALIFLVKTAIAQTFNKKIIIFTTNDYSLEKTNVYQDFDLIEISKTTLADALIKYDYQLIDGDKTLKDKIINFKKNNSNLIKNYKLIKEFINSDIIIMFNFKIFSDNFSNKYMQISSDIFYTKINSFINSWSVPIRKIKIPKNCDKICKKTILVENTIILSSRLGVDIGNYLKSIFEEEKQAPYSNKYVIKMLDLSTNNSSAIIDSLINEFPGYIELKEEMKNNFQKWVYFSSAKHEEIIYWFKSLIKRINSNDNNLKLIFKNKEIIIQN